MLDTSANTAARALGLCAAVIWGKTTKPSVCNLLEQQILLIPSSAHLSRKYNLLLKQPCTQLGVIQPAAAAALIHKDQFTEGSLQLTGARWWLRLPEGVGDKSKWPETNQGINAVPQSGAGCLLSAGA